MQDLSLHILDIAQNSIRAHADEIHICIEEMPSKNQLVLSIEDNGSGMPKQLAKQITDPFVTTRTLRRVGLGIPLLKQNCENSEGELSIDSEQGKGTIIKATMAYRHIDRVPLGDVVSTLIILIQSNPKINFIYNYQYEEKSFAFETAEVKKILGDVAIDNLDVLAWLKEYLEENMNSVKR